MELTTENKQQILIEVNEQNDIHWLIPKALI